MAKIKFMQNHWSLLFQMAQQVLCKLYHEEWLLSPHHHHTVFEPYSLSSNKTWDHILQQLPKINVNHGDHYNWFDMFSTSTTWLLYIYICMCVKDKQINYDHWKLQESNQKSSWNATTIFPWESRFRKTFMHTIQEQIPCPLSNWPSAFLFERCYGLLDYPHQEANHRVFFEKFHLLLTYQPLWEICHMGQEMRMVCE